LREFLRRRFSVEIRSAYPILSEHTFRNSADLVCAFYVPNMLQHQTSGEEKSQWISYSFPGDIRRGTMNRFKDRSTFTNICPGRHAKTPDKPRQLIGQNVAEEVSRDYYIELPWIHH
jgi:hypothetical protein